MLNSARSSRKRNAAGANPRQPAPLPPISDWTPQPPAAVPPSRRHELDFEVQRRQRSACEVLTNREQLIWLSSARNDSMAQTELYYTKVFHRPQETPKERVMYRDLKYGDSVPEEIMELVREDDERGRPRGEPKKRKEKRGAIKAKERAEQDEEQQASRAQEDDAMDVDKDDDEDGGVAVAAAVETPKKSSSG